MDDVSEPLAREPHVIRLGAAWCVERKGGGIVLLRPFNRPTGLTRGHRVTLVVVGTPGSARLSLNGELLHGPEAEREDGGVGEKGWRADVTKCLRSRNELWLEPAKNLADEELLAGRRFSLPVSFGGCHITDARLEIVPP